MRLLQLARLLALIAPLMMAGAWSVAAVACPVEDAVTATAAPTGEHDCTPKDAPANVQHCVAICHASVLPGAPQFAAAVSFHPVTYVVDHDEADGAGVVPDTPPPRSSSVA